MMIDPNANTRRGGGRNLAIRRGEILDVIQFTSREQILCRDVRGKCELVIGFRYGWNTCPYNPSNPNVPFLQMVSSLEQLCFPWRQKYMMMLVSENIFGIQELSSSSVVGPEKIISFSFMYLPHQPVLFCSHA
ncbi:PML-RARA-regulated adapter molecule 1 [Monodelphis domestica]|uniref:PML-RARA-regulated adapter molecule 1 n=1 Tax=Monodelphis domestica TaxID=13616 RepID=UPI0024E216BC|nr:PML-RARA-regulated adapter molecule 1 [Monodelphis domestica]XP_056678024.1 PML-RARA-regulated adapter molecule 1 [Monodelphis domestica]